MVASSSAGFLSSIRPRGRAVDEQHHVRSAGVAAFGDGELAHRQPVVVGGVLKVDHPDLVPAHPVLGISILDTDAIHEHPMKGAVTGFQRRAFRPGQFAEGVVYRIDRQTGIERRKCIPQPSLQSHFAIIISLGSWGLGCYLRSTNHSPAMLT